MKIAITGKIGSGKSLVSKYLQQLGANYINLDTITKILHQKQEIVNKIVTTFGEQYLNNNKLINKPKLRQLIFHNSEAWKKLNQIMWPEIKNIMKQKLANNSKKIIVVEGAVILQAQWAKYFDKIIYIKSNDKIRYERLINRDHITTDDFIAISKQQDSNIKYQKIIDDVIINNTTKVDVYEAINKIISKEKWKFN